MEQLNQFIKPELLVLIPVLFFVGAGLKKSKAKDWVIPFVLGFVGIVLALIWVLGTEGFGAIAIFTAVTQGILCAGASVYVNQLLKQKRKKQNDG